MEAKPHTTEPNLGEEISQEGNGFFFNFFLF